MGRGQIDQMKVQRLKSNCYSIKTQTRANRNDSIFDRKRWIADAVIGLVAYYAMNAKARREHFNRMQLGWINGKRFTHSTITCTLSKMYHLLFSLRNNLWFEIQIEVKCALRKERLMRTANHHAACYSYRSTYNVASQRLYISVFATLSAKRAHTLESEMSQYFTRVQW